MAKVFKIDGSTLPDGAILMEGGRTNLPGGVAGLPVAAWYCEPGIGTINVDDPEGAYNLRGWHTFTVDETESVGTERQWSGWLIGRRIMRGPYRDGPGRVWEVSILEINGLFNLEVFRANSAQRPAETDVARIQWMIASAAMAGTPVHDDGRLSTANPRNLSAAEFVRSFPTDMATNAAGQSGKNVYAYWRHADSEVAIHYDLLGAGPDCTLRVSNDMADTDSTTFYPFVDAELDADAYSLYTGVLLDYVGGAVYGRNTTLIDDLSPTEFSPVNFLRDQLVRSDRISRLTTANAYLATYLAAAAEEKESIVLSITVPPEDAGLIEAGMNMDVKLTHIPGLEGFTTLPIIRLSKIPTPNRTDTWDVRMEFSRNAKVTLAPGGDPDDFPVTNQCDIANVVLVQGHYASPTESPPFTFSTSWAAPPTPGNLLVASFTSGTNGLPVTEAMPGWTFQGEEHIIGVGFTSQYVNLWTRVSSGGADDTPVMTFTGVGFTGPIQPRMLLQEWAGVDTVDAVVTMADEVATLGVIQATISPTAGTLGVIVGVSGIGGNLSNLGALGGATIDNESQFSSDNTRNMIHKTFSNATGSYTIGTDATTGRKGAMVMVALTCSGDSGSAPPPIGKAVARELVGVGDGTTTTFTTDFAYAPGSLRVFVDGVQVILGLTETDPTTGSFTLDFAPKGAIGDTRAEEVIASYQVGWP